MWTIYRSLYLFCAFFFCIYVYNWLLSIRISLCFFLPFLSSHCHIPLFRFPTGCGLVLFVCFFLFCFGCSRLCDFLFCFDFSLLSIVRCFVTMCHMPYWCITMYVSCVCTAISVHSFFYDSECACYHMLLSLFVHYRCFTFDL